MADSNADHRRAVAARMAKQILLFGVPPRLARASSSPDLGQRESPPSCARTFACSSSSLAPWWCMRTLGLNARQTAVPSSFLRSAQKLAKHEAVNDPAALARALLAQPDVSGDPEQGWHRESDAGGGMLRSLAAINPGKSADRIEIFYRTQSLADEGRAWFEAVAGRSAGHLTREVTDPRSTHAKAARAAVVRPQGLSPRP